VVTLERRYGPRRLRDDDDDHTFSMLPHYLAKVRSSNLW